MHHKYHASQFPAPLRCAVTTAFSTGFLEFHVVLLAWDTVSCTPYTTLAGKPPVGKIGVTTSTSACGSSAVLIASDHHTPLGPRDSRKPASTSRGTG